MKRSLFFSLFCLVTFFNTIKAQVLLGGGPIYGDDISELGINLRAYTFLGENICLGPEFTRFGRHDALIGGDPGEVGLWEVNFNGHFIFEVGEGLGVYPLTGLNYSREVEMREGHEDEVISAFGANVGLGLHYETRSAVLYAEYDRLISDLGQNSFTVGILFFLGKSEKEEKAHEQ